VTFGKPTQAQIDQDREWRQQSARKAQNNRIEKARNGEIKGPKRGGRLATVGQRKKDNRVVVQERYTDSRGVPFDSYQLLPPLNGLPCRDWPKIKRVEDPVVCDVMHQRFDSLGCWECRQRGLQAHHMAEGSAGKSDEFTVIVMLCPACHAMVNTPALPLGRLLFLKWLNDRANTDWCRLALLHRKMLPDLITISIQHKDLDATKRR
jgi:hypothetical protein